MRTPRRHISHRITDRGPKHRSILLVLPNLCLHVMLSRQPMSVVRRPSTTTRVVRTIFYPRRGYSLWSLEVKWYVTPPSRLLYTDVSIERNRWLATVGLIDTGRPTALDRLLPLTRARVRVRRGRSGGECRFRGNVHVHAMIWMCFVRSNSSNSF